MIPVALKPLLARLDRQSARALEGAVGACVGRGHHEVTVEHLLLRLFDDPSADLAFILSHFDVEPERLRRSLQAALDDLPGGHAGKPVFSVEYTDNSINVTQYCAQMTSLGFTGIVKNRSLDAPLQACP